jgi:uncharacterized OB-fold protein
VSTPTPDWLLQLRAGCGALAGAPRTAPDAVNLPMIRRWCEAMGERNPLYLDEAFAARSAHGGIVAPPAMLEVWTMPRFGAAGEAHPPLRGIEALNAAGFTTVVATNLEQEYLRYLRLGDRITQRVFLVAVSDEKRTALGLGHFLDYRYEFTDQRDEPVGRMNFRILMFRPAALAATPGAARPAPARPRPSITRDSAFFWEGVAAGRLLARRCARCQHLHHPPGPTCPRCHALEWETVELSGRGVVHSYVVVHQPQLPGFTYPLPVALVQLEEGVRLVGNLSDIGPDAVRIGMPVEAEFREVEPGYVLYAFRRQRGA